MKVNGEMTKLMAMVPLWILKVQSIRVLGWKICNMVMEKRSGTMGQLSMLDSFTKERKMEKENFTGKMEVIMKEILLMDNFLGLEHIFSQILIKLIEENLEIVTWKVKGKKYGLMGENTR